MKYHGRLSLAAYALFMTGWACMAQPAFPVWTPISMVDNMNFPSPGRTPEANPGGPFFYSLPGPGQYAVDSACSYPYSPAVYLNGQSISGQPIYRGANNGNVSANESSFKGINVRASFSSSGSFEEVIFFSESRCYVGGREYGFVRNASTGAMSFYVANNANCFDPGQGQTECFSGSQQLHSIRNDYILPNLAGGEYYFAAFVFLDVDGQYKFDVSVQDANTFQYVLRTQWVPTGASGQPSFPQSDMPGLALANGFVSTSLGTLSGGSYNAGGNFRIYGVFIGR